MRLKSCQQSNIRKRSQVLSYTIILDFKKIFIYLFTFGGIGSLLLHEGFL